jgi:rhodanese-related sulfurtransferase
MTMQTLTPQQARQAIADGALLIDIRDPDEHLRERIPGAVNLPLARVAELAPSGQPVVFHCRSGMRTEANAGKLLAAASGAPCHVLGGGIEAWRSAGLPTALDRGQPIEVMRQVQLIAGGLVVLGVLLGLLVAPAFALLSAFVGGGLMMAGATGWCGMALLLRRMPWNRRAHSA